MADRMWEVEQRSAAYVRPLALKGGPLTQSTPSLHLDLSPTRTAPHPAPALGAPPRYPPPLPQQTQPRTQASDRSIDSPSQCNPLSSPRASLPNAVCARNIYAQRDPDTHPLRPAGHCPGPTKRPHITGRLDRAHPAKQAPEDPAPLRPSASNQRQRCAP
jgi:hypothetical protein